MVIICAVLLFCNLQTHTNRERERERERERVPSWHAVQFSLPTTQLPTLSLAFSNVPLYPSNSLNIIFIIPFLTPPPQHLPCCSNRYLPFFLPLPNVQAKQCANQYVHLFPVNTVKIYHLGSTEELFSAGMENSVSLYLLGASRAREPPPPPAAAAAASGGWKALLSLGLAQEEVVG